jgi:hypothetical protein
LDKLDKIVVTSQSRIKSIILNAKSDIEELRIDDHIVFVVNRRTERGKSAWEWAQINLGFHFATEIVDDFILNFDENNVIISVKESVTKIKREMISHISEDDYYLRLVFDDKAKAALFKLFWL